MDDDVLKNLPSGELRAMHLRRADVVAAFSSAFQMVGGVSRLALWADNHPTDFFKLYARLLPSAASDEMNAQGKIVVIHALPPPGGTPPQENHRILDGTFKRE